MRCLLVEDELLVAMLTEDFLGDWVTTWSRWLLA